MKIQQLHEALSILVRQQPTDDVAIANDMIFCGKYSPDLYTRKQEERLEELGFTDDGDSWCAFI